MSTSTLTSGRIVKVAGPVVDVEFPPDALPEILYALEVDLEVAGEQTTVICETAQHLGYNRVRAIALAPTDGVIRGTEVRNTGAPISVPVGDQTLGHIFNVWGDSLDAPDTDFPGERWPIHRPAPPCCAPRRRAPSRRWGPAPPPGPGCDRAAGRPHTRWWCGRRR